MINKFCQAVIVLVFISSIVIFKAAGYLQQQHNIENVITQAEKRIALDLPRLDLSNVFLKHSGNSAAIKGYLTRLNKALDNEVVTVEGIGDTKIEAADLSNRPLIVRHLTTSDDSVAVTFRINHTLWQLSDLISALILAFFAMAFGYWAGSIKRSKVGAIKARKQADETDAPEPFKLVIDLNTKTLGSTHDAALNVSLANKPLCFYLALIEFCSEQPDTILNQNKNVPDELIDIANKYFYRLIELGHTIRKRPNFSNSLEKTLSEIRAALDEVLVEYPELKEIYYPPKAHGEGSRSRLHSYGLNQISSECIEVIGK
ncbi:hypothetical protein [Pseudoalteromonas atlantica]|uniref:hypothetical protein n=1 Tax=Pseudoalteromonas atlantica TaxID=288 RepID=UPI0037358E63